MTQEYQEFKEASANIGSDIALIQGAGGNSSIKLSEDRMMVKASGKWLSEALVDDIFVAVDFKELNRRFRAGESDAKGVFPDQTNHGLRPSIETTLHALMPHRVVLHTHSVRTIANAISVNCTKSLAKKLQGLNWAYIPYSRPGEPLTRLVRRQLDKNIYDVLVIQNHGLVIGADTVPYAMAVMQDVEARLDAIQKPTLLETPPDARPEIYIKKGWAICTTPPALALSRNCSAMRIASRGSLFPDHVVFLGSGMGQAETFENAVRILERSRDSSPLAPKSVIVPNIGVVHAVDLSESGIAMIQAISQVALLAPQNAVLRYLTTYEEKELINWDAEKFRQASVNGPN